MRKIFSIALASVLLLSACAPNFQKQEEIVQDQKDSSEKAIIPKYKISDEYYRTILPFKESEARGLVVNNVYSKYDLQEFETGLMRIAQNTFDPDKYLFQEGQYLKSATVRQWLNRQYTPEQLETRGLDESENIGLNPLDNEQGDIAERYEKNPIYLAHILEHDYLIKGDNGKVSLGGLVIGLALNSVYYYQKVQYGATFQTKIDRDVLDKEGKKIAEEIIKRLRAMDGLKEIPITIALFEQESRTSIVPGSFFAYANAGKGSADLGDWKVVDENYMLFPSSEATTQYRDDATLFSNFKQDIEAYFPNFNGVVGRAFYAGGHLQELNIDIPIQFYGKTEAIGFTQFVTGKVMEHFPDYISIQVNISSVMGSEAIIVKDIDQKEPFVHIYK
ncbi:CamS family sex pheromone protein [Bacillus sp. V3B]|uniref:CamS family sex pheromone protein n=1 Tax=Bacillus sp. V3B TaxID=2804915 RepID=UPI00210CDE4E|nr:CamS family sex pheromone protein [Bacillus sp. V3B]MCQ6277030.1 CamS family sex pheromone protein [Bacillus sp. V3B]